MFSAEQLGERVLILRRRRHWTQRDLAREAGMNYVTVARIERGKMRQVSADIVTRLAVALGTSTDYLLGLKSEDEEEPVQAVA